MGFFFLEFEKDYKLKGTEHWTESESVEKEGLIQGLFSESTPNGRISMQLEADEEKIFFIHNGKMKSLELCLTLVEEHFSFLRSKSKRC